ncbi:hypothetical protein, partial [Staphylococcus pseudintermedius]|uniref:hypothetical protein n=1 Tax=Staphylococcus pseudintermedius TaxID=283734 RepID=UPI002887DC0B
NHTKPNIGGKSSIFHPKKTKIEDIFHGCLRFFGSKGTNGSAPFCFSPRSSEYNEEINRFERGVLCINLKDIF